MLRTVRSSPENAPALSPSESAVLDKIQRTRRPTWFGRFLQGFAYATGTVSRDEFDDVCFEVLRALDGKTMSPEKAQKLATRLIKAHTQAHAGVIVPKCDYGNQGVMVAWLGDPKSGFLFQHAITLIDPKGVKRAP